MFPSGFHPGEKIGGDWTCVAQDIVMPLGNSAPVSTSTTLNTLKSTTPLEFRMADGKDTHLPSGGNIIGANYNHMQVQQANAGNNKGAIYPVNLWADLSSATKTKLVSIWKRVE